MLFLEHLASNETGIEEPQEMLEYILASWNKVGGLLVERIIAWLEDLRVVAVLGVVEEAVRRVDRISVEV